MEMGVMARETKECGVFLRDFEWRLVFREQGHDFLIHFAPMAETIPKQDENQMSEYTHLLRSSRQELILPIGKSIIYIKKKMMFYEFA